MAARAWALLLQEQAQAQVLHLMSAALQAQNVEARIQLGGVHGHFALLTGLQLSRHLHTVWSDALSASVGLYEKTDSRFFGVVVIPNAFERYSPWQHLNAVFMKRLKKFGYLAGAAAVGMVAGGLGAKYGAAYIKDPAWSGGQKIGLLALLPVAWLLAVLAHELGHVLLGQTQGFAFRWLAVGPFMWKKELGRLRFSWNKDLNTAGGMALCVPPDEHNLRRRFLAFAAGGPLASALYAGVVLGVSALLPPATSGAGQVLAGALAVSGIISAALTVVTLIPMRAGGFYSDGARILNLWRGGVAGQLEVAVLSALIPSMAGTRPRELARPLLEAAAALPQELPFKMFVFHYLYLIALDNGHTEQAARYLHEYRERLDMLPDALQGGVWLESAFFAAAYQHDLPAAQAFHARATPSPHIQADVWARVEAALARQAGDAEQARAKAQLALQELPKNLDQGSARLYGEWLTDTLRWAEALPA
ncbi:M50 family metallopeptidase [Hymenobacter arizonensis]|uniref:Peptidase family M50 n=1 Tax=Hymenobacter arizonensis TaxID=1227077 RepID=A0A1I5TEA8_HYMAR|nr:M50 family metallopeptidase [Hymenobacter arizonensis]SFP81360.1 hypothetical protein SAMN04515668_0438 [Hymenobacter arizonensis]